MRKALALVMVLALAGCAYDYDRFGNELEPMPAAFDYNPVRNFQTGTKAELAAYCHRYRGTLSNDGNGCAIIWDTVVNYGQACTRAVVAGLPAGGLESVTRFMRSVCNGWHPASRPYEPFGGQARRTDERH